jgi:hypothetical protein
MNSAYFEDILALRDRWLEAQIRQLSIDLLMIDTYTCTACGEVLGEYIIDHSGEKFRLSKSEAYSFLKYILTTTTLK